MALLIPLLLGFALLGLFVFGGKVQGGGERLYMASAARAFVLPWLGVLALTLWIRWWGGTPLAEAGLTLVPAAILPVLAAFFVWRRLRG
jgi:hypothetical protein